MSALERFADSSRTSHEVREVPIPDSWNAAKLFARDHLRKNRCTTPKAGLESVAEVDIYQQATRRQRKMKPYLSNTALVAAVERKYDR